MDFCPVCLITSQLLRSLKFLRITENSALHGKSLCCPSKKSQTIPFCEQLLRLWAHTLSQRIRRGHFVAMRSAPEKCLFTTSTAGSIVSLRPFSFISLCGGPTCTLEQEESNRTPLTSGPAASSARRWKQSYPPAILGCTAENSQKGTVPLPSPSITPVVGHTDTKTQWSAQQGLHPWELWSRSVDTKSNT